VASSTTNYSLRKPAGSDTVNVTTDISDNMDDIDTQLARFGFKGTDIASAATLTLPAEGSMFDVTGSTGPVTAISTRTAGEIVVLEFDSTPTLTHNATALALAGNANVTVAAGDIYVFQSEGSGNWREVSRFIRASTPATAASVATAIASTATVLVGSDTTERTTTSTTTVDLSTVTVSIAKTVPFMVVASWRKTAVHASAANLGFKLNATEVKVPVAVSSSTAQVESGILRVMVGAHDASYLRPGLFESMGSPGATSVYQGLLTANMPDATVTSVIIEGSVVNATNTLAIDEVRVYTFPTT
jgi:hypothetical protein